MVYDLADKVSAALSHVRLPVSPANDMAPLFAMRLGAPVSWNWEVDLTALIGEPVRFRFVLKDADVFAMCTTAAVVQ